MTPALNHSDFAMQSVRLASLLDFTPYSLFLIGKEKGLSHQSRAYVL